MDLSTWSVQYASAAGLSWTNLTRLTGSIAPGQYYLVAEAAGTGSPAALPTPDVTGTINLSGTAGNVALVNDQTNLTCQRTACAAAPSVVDLVGYGETAMAFAGTAAPAASNATSVARNSRSGNTADNGADFTAGGPTPKVASAGGDASPPTPTEHTIAEIQGTTDISPLAGSAVITEGVVTAPTRPAVSPATRSRRPAPTRQGHPYRRGPRAGYAERRQRCRFRRLRRRPRADRPGLHAQGGR